MFDSFLPCPNAHLNPKGLRFLNAGLVCNAAGEMGQRHMTQVHLQYLP